MNDAMRPNLTQLNDEQKRELLAQLLARKQADQQRAAQRFPLSHAQRRLWFMDQLHPGHAAYHIPAALVLEGDLDCRRLELAIQRVIQRHESLRCHFPAEQGEPFVQINTTHTFSLSSLILNEGDEQPQLEKILHALVAEPFELAVGPLLRVRLLKSQTPQRQYLLLCLHHIIADYWSLRILVKEIAAFYSAGESAVRALPNLPVQYADYAVWQQQRNESLASSLNYWQKQLRNLPPALPLPQDRPRPAVATSAGARHHFEVSAELSQRIQQFSRVHQSSLFATLLAAFQVLLFRYTGQTDILVGSTVSNRDHRDTRDLIGLFVNNLVLRARPTADISFTDLLQQVRQTVLDALAHEDLPFENLVDALKVERRLDRHPLFQILFVLHNTPAADIRLPGISLSGLPLEVPTTRFDLALDMVETATGLYGTLEYSTDIFDAATIADLATQFLLLLDVIMTQPTQTLGTLPWHQEGQPLPLQQYRGPYQALSNNIAQLLTGTAQQYPDKVALVCGDISLTYQQLQQRTTQLMHVLWQRDIQVGQPVALCLPRTPELVIALLACLRLGLPYIPLDIRQPGERLRTMLDDARPVLALVQNPDTTLTEILPCARLDVSQISQPNHILYADITDTTLPPDHLAYIIFTSGSTGRPKGVPITRQALENFLVSMQAQPGLLQNDRLLAITTVAFDIAALELLLPLVSGATLILADDFVSRDGIALAQALARHHITHMQATPATWRLLVESGWHGQSNLTMLCGGEALETTLAQQLLSRGKALWNLYGPTETAIWSAAMPVDQSLLERAHNKLPIGGAIANTWLAVVDEQRNPLPVNVSGELLIGGAGLSPGYQSRPQLTAEKFITLSGSSGTLHAYRTGDRVRRRHDGLIEFLGRVDHQIKLRGFRIEPGEIETQLNSHPAVAHSIAGLWSLDNGDTQLVAWLKLHDGQDSADVIIDLRRHLAQALPAYMQPSSLVIVSEFPLNANGKVDRRSLPASDTDSRWQDHHHAIIPLQGETEQALAALWNSLLPMPVSSADDNFFSLGGHSLLAARMLAQVNHQLHANIPLRALFEHPTLREVAQLIEDITPQHNPIRQASIPRFDRNQPLPLSAAQRRQWVLAQLEPESPFYNIPAAVNVAGPLSVPHLQQALSLLCERHENLRTSYPAQSGEPSVHLIDNSHPTIDCHDLRLLTDTTHAEQQALILLESAAHKPFDLAQGPLLRICVVHLPGEHHQLLLVLHHILADAGSMQILLGELSHLYAELIAGRTASALPNLALQYADYAAWQSRQDQSAGLAYWKTQLSNAPTLLDLPTDFSRPRSQQFAGASVPLSLNTDQHRQLKELAQIHGTTLFAVLLTLFQWLLSRYSNMQDILVGTPVGHRPHPDLDRVIGLFANTLVLRTHIKGNETLPALLKQVHNTALDAFQHQQAPFDQVLEQLEVPRNWAHAPLFQVMFLWQPKNNISTHQQSRLPHWQPLPLNHNTSKLDLTLQLVEEEDGIAGRLEYRTDLFLPDTMSSMAEVFQTLVEAVCRDPSQPLQKVCLASPTQQAQLKHWNQPDWGASSLPKANEQAVNLATFFHRQAQRTPDACAIIAGHHQWTYAELDRQSSILAWQLREQGVTTESTVGICLPRTDELIIALLATLKAGGIYVPLDPTYPTARLALILDDANPRVLICTAELQSLQFCQYAQANGATLLNISDALRNSVSTTDTDFHTAITGNETAYLIYTSGSTGRPKGVTIEHRQAHALLHWALAAFTPAQLSGTLVSTSICFDLSVFEIFVPLACGGTLILADNVLELPNLPAANRVTLINTVPTAAAELLRMGPLPFSVSTVNLAGEPIPASLVQALYRQPNVRDVFNLYGPSEDTTYSTGTRLEPALPLNRPVPIGRPITDTQAHVLNEQLQPVAIGMTGELYLGGTGVARGYWNQPDLTATRFLPDPFSPPDGLQDARLYRTGDRVRLRSDSQLEFLGRIDQQVKIRGFRIETGDIEAALEQHPLVTQAVVSAHRNETGHARLIAYLVCDSALQRPAHTLRHHLQALLPDYMLPALYQVLDALPRLPNGKIDRGGLPLPMASESDGSDTGTEPASGEHAFHYTTLQTLWKKVLGREHVSPDAHFFELGGDSILAIQLVSQARQAGITLAPRDVFQFPTLGALAVHAQQQVTLTQINQEAVTGPVPLLPIQHWFLTQPLHQRAHWNQSLLLKVKSELNTDILLQAVSALAQQHDVLRARFRHHDNQWQQSFLPELNHIPLTIIETECSDPVEQIYQYADIAHAGLSLEQGPLWQLIYFDLKTQQGPIRRLLLVAHHLIIDGVSWRLLLQDLQLAYEQLAQRLPLQMPARTHSARDQVEKLIAALPVFEQERPFWQQQCSPVAPLPMDMINATNRMADTSTVSVSFSADHTLRWLQELPAAYRIKSDELLLTAVMNALFEWSGRSQLQIALESHGRDGLHDLPGNPIDLSHTLGWFTSLYPLKFERVDLQPDQILRHVKSILRAVPNQGLGYGALRWLHPHNQDESLHAQPPICFNYLGQSDALFQDNPAFAPASEHTGRARHPDDLRTTQLEINALVSQGELRLHWQYSRAQYHEETINALAKRSLYHLRHLLDHCLSGQHDGGLSATDFPQMEMSDDELDSLLDNL